MRLENFLLLLPFMWMIFWVITFLHKYHGILPRNIIYRLAAMTAISVIFALIVHRINVATIIGIPLALILFLTCHRLYGTHVISPEIVEEVPEPQSEPAYKQLPSGNLILNEIEEKLKAWERRNDRPYLNARLTVADAAYQIGISATTLSAHVRQSKRGNFNSWINTLRIHEAQRLMRRHPQMTSIQIAERCGFADSACLSRAFKQIVGLPPSQWRKQLSES